MRALIVEDSAMMRRLLRSAVERVGDIEVVEAENGLAALQVLMSDAFDLIVTDLNMPRMDGLKLIAQIRSEARHHKTPILVVTTEQGEADRTRALSLGANGYIVKPIRAPELVAKARELLML